MASHGTGRIPRRSQMTAVAICTMRFPLRALGVVGKEACFQRHLLAISRRVRLSLVSAFKVCIASDRVLFLGVQCRW